MLAPLTVGGHVELVGMDLERLNSEDLHRYCASMKRLAALGLGMLLVTDEGCTDTRDIDWDTQRILLLNWERDCKGG